MLNRFQNRWNFKNSWYRSWDMNSVWKKAAKFFFELTHPINFNDDFSSLFIKSIRGAIYQVAFDCVVTWLVKIPHAYTELVSQI